MAVSPLFLVGIAIFFLGGALFGTQLFGHGGWAKSKQFRVIGELLRGAHGTRARRWVVVSLVLLPMGMCLIFSGVTASDFERAERCERHCAREGYASGRIGPNSDRDPQDRSTWFVACICDGNEREPAEFVADTLTDPAAP